VAVTALATLPLDGALRGSAATAPPATDPTTSGRATPAFTLRSLSDAAATSQAAAATNGGTGSSKDAVQSPTRSGGVYRSPSGAAAPKAAATTLAVPKVAPTNINHGSTAVESFDGINAYQQRYEAGSGNQFTYTPPDQGLCVGNGFVMESVNSAIRVFDKSGKALTPPIASNAFYGYPPAINRTTGESGPEITDPSCYYDPQYQRWFHVALTLDTDPKTGNLTLGNHLDIAVSATNNPLGGWVIYRTQAIDDGTLGTPKHTSCPCIGDYPHIGADRYGFYITTNEYPWGSGPGVFGNNYNGAQVYAFSKFWLAQNSSSVPFQHFGNLTLAGGAPSFTLWPSEVPGTAFDTRNNGTEWFTQSTAAVQETNNAAGMSNNIGIWRLTNTKSLDTKPAATLTSTKLASEVYGVPPPSEQKVGPVPLRDCLLITCLPGVGPSRNEVEGPLDSNDSRMQAAWLAGGQLFAALDTIVNVEGRYQAGVAWFTVNVAGSFAQVAVAHQGYNAVRGNITYPSIATRADGTGVMALTLSGANYYPTAAYLMVGPSGTSGLVIAAKNGAGPADDFCQYNFFDCAGTPQPVARPRWGDYGAAAVDGTQVWIASEYIGQTCTIDQYQADPHCGNTRATLTNWDTRVTQVTP
jgi:hypothetical protein